MGFKSPHTVVSQQDALALALGVQFESFAPTCANSSGSPTSGRAFGNATYATAGAVVNGIKLRIGTAAVGTSPTTARFGLADNTGKILILSGNLNTAASWPTGAVSFPFTAKYQLLYTGIYYPCFIVSGTWGTTQPVLISINTLANSNTADGSHPIPNFTLTGQTDLPAIGASFSSMPADNRIQWIVIY